MSHSLISLPQQATCGTELAHAAWLSPWLLAVVSAVACGLLWAVQSAVDCGVLWTVEFAVDCGMWIVEFAVDCGLLWPAQSACTTESARTRPSMHCLHTGQLLPVASARLELQRWHTHTWREEPSACCVVKEG